jgi:DNA-binding GntR family transcriptional regulator
MALPSSDRSGFEEGAVVRPPSLAEHAQRVLRDDIVSGRLAPGERLTELELIERTGVSRTSVRDGVRRLEAEGLVVSHRGRGTYVAFRLSPEEALLVYDCRLTLEPYLTRRAAERITPEALAVVKRLLERLSNTIGADPAEAGRLDAEFHLGIYEASRSELTSVLRGYWTRIQLELSERVYTEEMPREFASEHIAIFEAIEQRNGELAAERMLVHLKHGRRALERALSSSTG